MFDILKFLGLSLGLNEKEFANEKLLGLLGNYIIVKTVSLLPEEKLDSITTPKELFELAIKEIPDFNTQVQEFVLEFKNRYHKETNLT